jgi:catalase (peroxidase I)
MKISIPTAFFATLIAGSVLAYPELEQKNKNNGKPCSFLEETAQEEAYAAAGQGYRQVAMRALNERTGDGGVPSVGFKVVEQELIDLMTDSQPEWPADDFGAGQVSYAGLFIRLAWHCSGSYRESDGRGGCDGGRIRFAPEAEWPDNANLDKARMLLQPTKDKYGSELSWGDLIILAGNAAIKSTGGTILGFCGGRIDDADGSNSLILGPSDMQEQHSPCLSLDMQGDCLSVDNTALGPTTVGLIYVNPEGPVTAPNDPVAAAADIRRAFERMGFGDQISTILIGAGHAIGKAHGNPNGTFTSGPEGPWTTTPTTWSNEYFRNLFAYNYSLVESPGGAMQWSPDNGPSINMLTTDLALAQDEGYLPYAQMYANDFDLHNEDFASAWYHLTSADMGPAVRCIGDLVPAEPQEFQHSLPPSPSPGDLPNYVPIAEAIEAHFADDSDHMASFIQLSYNCAATFRATDYRGGCNGARIRFPPESEWASNAELAVLIEHLEEIKTTGDFDVSMADMIVLSGILALEKSNPDLDLPFCGGYVDAEDGSGSEPLAPRFYSPANITVTDDFQVKGLTPEQGVALFSATSVGSQYYIDLLAAGSDSTYTDEELALVTDEDLLPIVETYAADEAALLEAFSSGWTYLMTADRFKNNRENACTGVSTAFKTVLETPSPVAAPTPDAPSSASTAGVLTGVVTIMVTLLSFYC